jgi:rare lipoprotein A
LTQHDRCISTSNRKFVSLGQFARGCALLLILIAGCEKEAPPSTPPGYPKPYKVTGKWYQPIPDAKGFRQKGTASWYGKKFHGKKTASGEIYDMYAISAAHKTLPLQTYVRVRNLDNQQEVVVRINDRGPFVRGRIIDLSYAAAKKIGIVGPGTAPVEIVALGTAEAKTKKGTHRSYRPADYFTGNFTIQVGAFKNRNNAEKLKNKLDQTYKNAHISVYKLGDDIFYRVRVGKSSTLGKAIEYESHLIKNGYPDAMVIAE